MKNLHFYLRFSASALTLATFAHLTHSSSYAMTEVEVLGGASKFQEENFGIRRNYLDMKQKHYDDLYAYMHHRGDLENIKGLKKAKDKLKGELLANTRNSNMNDLSITGALGYCSSDFLFGKFDPDPELNPKSQDYKTFDSLRGLMSQGFPDKVTSLLSLVKKSFPFDLSKPIPDDSSRLVATIMYGFYEDVASKGKGNAVYAKAFNLCDMYGEFSIDAINELANTLLIFDYDKEESKDLRKKQNAALCAYLIKILENYIFSGEVKEHEEDALKTVFQLRLCYAFLTLTRNPVDGTADNDILRDSRQVLPKSFLLQTPDPAKYDYFQELRVGEDKTKAKLIEASQSLFAIFAASQKSSGNLEEGTKIIDHYSKNVESALSLLDENERSKYMEIFVKTLDHVRKNFGEKVRWKSDQRELFQSALEKLNLSPKKEFDYMPEEKERAAFIKSSKDKGEIFKKLEQDAFGLEIMLDRCLNRAGEKVFTVKTLRDVVADVPSAGKETTKKSINKFVEAIGLKEDGTVRFLSTPSLDIPALYKNDPSSAIHSGVTLLVKNPAQKNSYYKLGPVDNTAFYDNTILSYQKEESKGNQKYDDKVTAIFRIDDQGNKIYLSRSVTRDYDPEKTILYFRAAKALDILYSYGYIASNETIGYNKFNSEEDAWTKNEFLAGKFSRDFKEKDDLEKALGQYHQEEKKKAEVLNDFSYNAYLNGEKITTVDTKSSYWPLVVAAKDDRQKKAVNRLLKEAHLSAIFEGVNSLGLGSLDGEYGAINRLVFDVFIGLSSDPEQQKAFVKDLFMAPLVKFSLYANKSDGEASYLDVVNTLEDLKNIYDGLSSAAYCYFKDLEEKPIDLAEVSEPIKSQQYLAFDPFVASSENQGKMLSFSVSGLAEAIESRVFGNFHNDFDVKNALKLEASPIEEELYNKRNNPQDAKDALKTVRLKQSTNFDKMVQFVSAYVNLVNSEKRLNEDEEGVLKKETLLNLGNLFSIVSSEIDELITDRNSKDNISEYIKDEDVKLTQDPSAAIQIRERMKKAKYNLNQENKEEKKISPN